MQSYKQVSVDKNYIFTLVIQNLMIIVVVLIFSVTPDSSVFLINF